MKHVCGYAVRSENRFPENLIGYISVQCHHFEVRIIFKMTGVHEYNT